MPGEGLQFRYLEEMPSHLGKTPQVSAALRSAAGKALGDVKGSKSEDAKHDSAGNQTLRTEERSETPDEEEGRILTGAYVRQKPRDTPLVLGGTW